MEKDDEIKGNGNSYDFGARIYDARLGTWLSVDPLAHKYPGESPYIFAGDNPIFFIDLGGTTKYVHYIYIDEATGETVKVTVVKSQELMKVAKQVASKPFGLDVQDTHTEYDWYDIEETHTYTKKADGTVTEEHKTTRGAYRTTTNFDWGEGYANFKIISEPTGGIHFMSSKFYNGTPDRKGDASVRIEEIDVLLDALRGFGGVLKMGSGGWSKVKIPDALLKNNKLVKILNEVASKIGNYANASDANYKANKYHDALNNPDAPAKKKVCTVCSDTLDMDAPQEHHTSFDTIEVKPTKNEQK
jgi:RHS repeat-associated protein